MDGARARRPKRQKSRVLPRHRARRIRCMLSSSLSSSLRRGCSSIIRGMMVFPTVGSETHVQTLQIIGACMIFIHQSLRRQNTDACTSCKDECSRRWSHQLVHLDYVRLCVLRKLTWHCECSMLLIQTDMTSQSCGGSESNYMLRRLGHWWHHDFCTFSGASADALG